MDPIKNGGYSSYRYVIVYQGVKGVFLRNVQGGSGVNYPVGGTHISHQTGPSRKIIGSKVAL